MEFRFRMAAILILCVITWHQCYAGCDVDSVAVYRVTLNTFWSEDKFPKDYPQGKPTAQWSQIFGQSHNPTYSLYKIGEVARDSVGLFSKKGQADSLVEEGQDEPKVYDQFLGGPIGKGVGSAENVILVDKPHSCISLICRLVPSPDWFVGVDSVDLCVDSSWIDELDLELHPLDAGAASGLSFTSPYWETVPRAAVARIGPKSPAHSGSAFYYPELRDLPAIAHLQIVKIKEYTTKEMNEFARNELLAKISKNDERKNPKFESTKFEKTFPKHEEMTTKSYVEKLKELEEDPVGTPRSSVPDDNVVVVTESHKTESLLSRASTESYSNGIASEDPIKWTSVVAAYTPLDKSRDAMSQEFDGDFHSMDEVVLAVAKGSQLGLGRRLPRHFRSRLHHAVNRIRPDDCLVSSWGNWSPCSVTCGTGKKYRYRNVVRYPVNEGRVCPELNESAACGAKDSCEVDYD